MGAIIDLTSLFPWRILMLFAYSFAYYNILHAIVKDKVHPLVTFSSIFALRIVLSIIFTNSSLNALGFPLFLILSFILIVFLTKGKIVEKIIASIFYFISDFFTKIILTLMLGIIFNGKDYEQIFGTENENLDFAYLFLVKVVCFISISFLFAGILKLFVAKKSKQRLKKIYAYFSFFPLSHIFTIIIALFVASTGAQSNDFGMTVNILVYLFMAVILVFDCSFPFVADHFEKMEYDYSENKKELVKSKLKYEQTKLLTDEIQQTHKIKHDFLNIIATAKSFIEQGNTQKAIEIMDNTNADLKSSSEFYICSNQTLNTILYIKLKQAKLNGVKLSMDINESANLLIDDYSVCRIMHNILDNAIEAAEKAEQKQVSVLININDDKFKFECNNFYDKSLATNSRQNGRGYGIGIVKELVKNYKGTYYSNSDDESYYVSVELPNIDNKEQ